MRILAAMVVMVLGATLCSEVMAQSSSMLRLPTAPPNSAAASHLGGVLDEGPYTSMPPRDQARPATRAIEMVSMIAIPPTEPRRFKPNDLITIIVRQNKQYQADSRYNRQKRWNFQGKLTDWIKFHDGVRHLGSASFTRGEPGIKFDLTDRDQNDGQFERRDQFVTRLQARVIDVKPNGNLVLEATSQQQHDEEVFEITLTGVCRSDDVTPDNSILSTQIADLVLKERNKGAVRDSTKRGWGRQILDFARPF